MMRPATTLRPAALAALSAILLAMPAPAQQVVVSQIYGGGQAVGAVYKCDFIEIFNRGTSVADLTGWSVQYAAATGTAWTKTDLSGTLAPGQYLLVAEACGASGANLPNPDVLGNIALDVNTGKVALVSNGLLLSGGCPLGGAVVDFVGYGSLATCFEGSGPTAPINASTAALRNSGSCSDVNSNNLDFSVAYPSPRNRNSSFGACNPVAAGPPTWGRLKITYR